MAGRGKSRRLFIMNMTLSLAERKQMQVGWQVEKKGNPAWLNTVVQGRMDDIRCPPLITILLNTVRSVILRCSFEEAIKPENLKDTYAHLENRAGLG